MALGRAARRRRRPAAVRPPGPPPRGPRGRAAGGGHRVGRSGSPSGSASACSCGSGSAATATTEYVSAYLVEQSLSVDNVFVWAIILTFFAVPAKYQHRVLFWGIFGALVLRATFIFAGVALIERFDWILYVFGAFLLFTAIRLLLSDGEDQVDPSRSRFLKVVHRVVPSTDVLDGPHLFTKIDGRRLATPLVRRAGARRAHRPDLRRRQRPGRPVRQQRAVHRVLLERLRHPRPALDVLPARRPARPLPVPPAGPGRDPRLRRCEDADRRVGGDPDVDVAGRHRGRAARGDHAVVALPRSTAGGDRRIPGSQSRTRSACRPRAPSAEAGATVMAIADDDIERLRSTVSIVDVVGQFVTLRKVGRNWVGLCPFHAEKSPSFNVREETGRYKCFGCDKSGDVFTFVQEHEHLDFVGAVEYLAARAGMQLNYTSTGQSRERAQRKQLVEAMATAVEWYHQRLLEDPAARAARDYLRSRGLERRRRPPVQARLGARRLGRAGPAVGHRRRAAAGDRAGVRQPAQPAAGRPAGAGAVPDLLRHRRGGGHRRPHPARLGRPGEVQELAGDADLRQVQDAVRAELGQGRHRRVRPGRGVRGLHRRHRLPPRRRDPGRGDVRHGVHRGPRAAAQALRQPGRAGLRRRRRRPGRGRALLRVGAEVPGPGVGGPAARRAGPGRAWPSAIPTRWPPRSAAPRRSWPSACSG